MDMDDRLRLNFAIVWIVTIFLIILSVFNWFRVVTSENNSLKNVVKSKNKIIDVKSAELQNSLNEHKQIVENKDLQINRLIEIEKSNRGEISEIRQQLEKFKKEKLKLEEELRISRGGDKFVEIPQGAWKITSYDLSFDSCGKYPGDYWYGMTAMGFNLIGKTREEAMCVAVDPAVIKLGSKIKLIFIKDEFKLYDGIYNCLDTGGAIKGKILDLFLGDTKGVSKEVDRFGIQYAMVEIIK